MGGCWRKDNSNYIRMFVAQGNSNIAFPAEKRKKHENRLTTEKDFIALLIQTNTIKTNMEPPVYK